MWLAHKLRAAAKKSITVISTVGTIVTASATTLGNLPSNFKTGDLLVIFVSISRGSGSIITPAGWTPFLTAVEAQRTGAYYRVADGSEGSTVTFDMASITGTVSFNILLIRNYKTINTVGAFATSDIISPITNAGITPTAKGVLLAFWGLRSNSTTPVTVTGGPAGMTLANIVSGFTADNAMTNAVYYQEWNAIATGTREITTSGTMTTTRSLLIQLT